MLWNFSMCVLQLMCFHDEPGIVFSHWSYHDPFVTITKLCSDYWPVYLFSTRVFGMLLRRLLKGQDLATTKSLFFSISVIHQNPLLLIREKILHSVNSWCIPSAIELIFLFVFWHELMSLRMRLEWHILLSSTVSDWRWTSLRLISTLCMRYPLSWISSKFKFSITN